MKTGSELIHILIDKGHESEKLLHEIYQLIGSITSKETAKNYPKLLELKQKLKSEIYDERER